jgi:hypothetical protein
VVDKQRERQAPRFAFGGVVDAFHQDRRSTTTGPPRPSAAITVNAVDADDAVRRLMWEAVG